jgi:hypothetical protein
MVAAFAFLGNKINNASFRRWKQHRTPSIVSTINRSVVNQIILQAHDMSGPSLA